MALITGQLKQASKGKWTTSASSTPLRKANTIEAMVVTSLVQGASGGHQGDGQVAFDVSLEAAGYPVKAGASYGQLNEEQKKGINIEASKRIKKMARGGDPAAVNVSSKFIATLGKAENWAVIKYLELLPTPELLPGDLRGRCALAIDRHCLHPTTFKKTTLDMHYVRALNAGASDDFV